MIEDIIFQHYKSKTSTKPKLIDLKQIQSALHLNLTTCNIGIGDAVILTSLTNDKSKNLNIYSNNRHWNTLAKFNKNLNKEQSNDVFLRTELLEFYDIGNGHLAQRLQRAIGLKVETIPKPYLFTETLPQKNKVGLHFSTGRSAFDLIQHGFENPRQLLESSRDIVDSFIKNTNFEFIEFGEKQIFPYENVENATNLSIKDSIKKLAECEYFIGLNSGFMNIAAGLSIKSIIIVNVPNVNNLFLPVLVDCGSEDMNWLYPQNVHLFQNGENPLVPKLSFDNLLKSINGEVYPFWDSKYLDLIYDYNFSR
jgi:hypothetical protein